MAKDVLITPASGKLEVKASNGTTVETKIEDGKHYQFIPGQSVAQE